MSSANGLLVQFGIQQQQQQNNNNKIISSKLKSLGTSSTTSLKKINSSPSINNLNDQIYKQNLTKITLRMQEWLSLGGGLNSKQKFPNNIECSEFSSYLNFWFYRTRILISNTFLRGHVTYQYFGSKA